MGVSVVLRSRTIVLKMSTRLFDCGDAHHPFLRLVEGGSTNLAQISRRYL